MTGWDVQRALSQRETLVETLDDPRWQRIVGEDYLDTFTTLKRIEQRVDAHDHLMRRWRLSIEVSETFTMTNDLQHVVEAAAEDLPEDWVAEHHHLYVEHGFLSLARPTSDEVRQTDVHVITWHHGSGGSTRYKTESGMIVEGKMRAVPGIEINLWARTPGGTWIPTGSDFLPYGLPSLGWILYGVNDDGTDHLEPESSLSMATRIVLALQSFMRQELPGIVRHRVPRPDQRRMKRLGMHQDTITVIDLRRRQTQEREEPTGRTLTYRHLVRGHWHHYWVGTGHVLHSGLTDDRERVPVYLSPYLKGPDDAPIRPTPTRVHVVRR